MRKVTSDQVSASDGGCWALFRELGHYDLTKKQKQTNKQTKRKQTKTVTRIYCLLLCTLNNNNVHLSCAHQSPERSHDTY